MSPPERRTLTFVEMIDACRTMRTIDPLLRRHRLTGFLFLLLVSLAESPGAPLIVSARAIGAPPTHVTVGVDRLEAYGLVSRVPRQSEPADRRKVIVLLTERGRELLQTLSETEIEPVGESTNGAAL